MKRSWRKRLCAAFLALCVMLAAPMSVVARTISEIEEEQSRLESEKAALEAQLEQLRSDEAQKREYQQALQQKIDVMEEQIDAAQRDIDDLNLRITELTLKLEKAREEIQNTYDQFKERLVALYKAGDVSTLEILLNSESFSDFTMRTELINAMTLHDQELMNIIEQYMEDTKDEQTELEADKRMVANLKKKLEREKEELDELYAENEAAIIELMGAEANTQKLIEDNEAELAANEAEIADLIEKQRQAEEEARRRQEAEAAAAVGSPAVGGSYPTGGGGVAGFNPIWPLPGVYYVSCYYGGYAGHRGMDIAGSYGTPVVAAESGTVIAANNYDSWGMSWGYYVLIYHNSTFTTRYAHLSGLTVYQGQYVEQGTVVGYEGATGNVTGPHLHFEVYQNGTRVDPMIYL